MTKKSKRSKKATKSSKRNKVLVKPGKKTKAASKSEPSGTASATTQPTATPVTRSSSARANISEGTRLFALAGRPTKAQLIRVYGPKGPTLPPQPRDLSY